jgi:imidazole glycerol-phosphate synthase subunit HisF
MLAVRIIPCLDVRDGLVVKGVQFQDLQTAGDPADLTAEYERQGADELALLDISATPQGRKTCLDTIRRVRAALALPLLVGGGVREAEDAGALLDAGADKVSVNTAAVERPDLIDELAVRFGRQCTVLAIDAAMRDDGGFEVVTRSGKVRTGIDAVAWAKEATARGAGEILLTSWDRDGTLAGYHLELIEQVAGAVDVPIIASGGARSAEHMAEAVAAGATGLLAASIFHYGQCTVGQLKDQLRTMDVEIRR